MLTGLPLRAAALAVLLLPMTLTAGSGHAQETSRPEAAALRLFVIERQGYAGRMSALSAALEELVPPAAAENGAGKHIAINANGDEQATELRYSVDKWIANVARARRISPYTPKTSVANLRRRIGAHLATLNDEAANAPTDAARTAEIHLFLSEMTFTVAGDDGFYKRHDIGRTGFSDGCFNLLSHGNGQIEMTDLILRVYVYPPDGQKLPDETMRSIARALDLDPARSNTAQLLLGQGNLACPQPDNIAPYTGLSFNREDQQCRPFDLRTMARTTPIVCPDPDPTLFAHNQTADPNAAAQTAQRIADQQKAQRRDEQLRIQRIAEQQQKARRAAEEQKAQPEAARREQQVRQVAEEQHARQSTPLPPPVAAPNENHLKEAPRQLASLQPTEADLGLLPAPPSNVASQHMIRRGYVLSEPIIDQSKRNRLKSMALLIDLESGDPDMQIHAAFSPTGIDTAEDGMKIAAPAKASDLRLSMTALPPANSRGEWRYYLAVPCREGRKVSAAVQFHGHPSGRNAPAVSRRITIEQNLVSCPGPGPALIPFGVELTR